METVRGVEGFITGLFLRGEGGVELAGGDLFGGGVDEAELAGGEVVLCGAHRWAEGAAEDGAMLIEVAGAVAGVEDGTGFVVGELFEEDGGFVIFVEDAGGTVAGKPGVEAGEGVGYSCVDACGFGWIRLFESSETFAEAGGVFLGNGEDSNAALGAAGMADEVCTAASIGVGYSGIYDLDESVGGIAADENCGVISLGLRLVREAAFAGGSKVHGLVLSIGKCRYGWLQVT